jgi:L-alanine-DL-glutamate epimerase-like enolase superfamily enzyme
MVQAIRNPGRPGVASMAIAAVDTALWDLKARLLKLPLVSLFGAARESIPVYGSGGFTSYSVEQLQQQLAGWADEGIPRVKMKIGTHPEQDVHRVRAATPAVVPALPAFCRPRRCVPRDRCRCRRIVLHRCTRTSVAPPCRCGT